MSVSRESLIAYWSEENKALKAKGYFDYASQRMFAKFLPDFRGKTVLDVGCGLGMMMERFSREGNRVLGIDITPQVLKEFSKEEFFVQEADARDIPFQDNTFDLVYSLGVIEHFDETQQALEEQVRVCKPGGWVVAVVPYAHTPYYWASVVFERLTRPEHDLQVTYGRAFSKGEFRSMFEKANCEDIGIQPYYGSAFMRVLFNQIHGRWVDFIEDSFLSSWFGLVVWGIGRKKGV